MRVDSKGSELCYTRTNGSADRAKAFNAKNERTLAYLTALCTGTNKSFSLIARSSEIMSTIVTTYIVLQGEILSASNGLYLTINNKSYQEFVAEFVLRIIDHLTEDMFDIDRPKTFGGISAIPY